MYGRFTPSVRGGALSNAEMKYFDNVYAAVGLTAAGVVLGSINLVNQGTAPNNALGRKIVIKSVECRGEVQMNQSSAVVVPGVAPYGIQNVPLDANYRFMLVLDTQANGALPVPTDLLTGSLYSFRDLSNTSRFRVLKEWVGGFNSMFSPFENGGTSVAWVSSSNSRPFKWYKKCNIEIEYAAMAGGTRNINEVKSNNLFIIGYADFTNVILTMHTRIRFYDN